MAAKYTSPLLFPAFPGVLLQAAIFQRGQVAVVSSVSGLALPTDSLHPLKTASLTNHADWTNLPAESTGVLMTAQSGD